MARWQYQTWIEKAWQRGHDDADQQPIILNRLAVIAAQAERVAALATATDNDALATIDRSEIAALRDAIGKAKTVIS
jgi:hypothetical protein